jgi:hypothetical protein
MVCACEVAPTVTFVSPEVIALSRELLLAARARTKNVVTRLWYLAEFFLMFERRDYVWHD